MSKSQTTNQNTTSIEIPAYELPMVNVLLKHAKNHWEDGGDIERASDFNDLSNHIMCRVDGKDTTRMVNQMESVELNLLAEEVALLESAEPAAIAYLYSSGGETQAEMEEVRYIAKRLGRYLG